MRGIRPLSPCGSKVSAITQQLNYLVIGEIGAHDWIHSPHGRKIEKAIDYNERGCRIAIIGEEHWHGFLR